MWFLASIPSLQGTSCVFHPSQPTGSHPAPTMAPPASWVNLLAGMPQVFVGNSSDFNYILFYIRVHPYAHFTTHTLKKEFILTAFVWFLFFLLNSMCSEKKTCTRIRQTNFMNLVNNLNIMFLIASIHQTASAYHEHLTIGKIMNEEKQKGSIKGDIIKKVHFN